MGACSGPFKTGLSKYLNNWPKNVIHNPYTTRIKVEGLPVRLVARGFNRSGGDYLDPSMIPNTPCNCGRRRSAKSHDGPGNIDEEIYMDEPEGFERPNKPHLPLTAE